MGVCNGIHEGTEPGLGAAAFSWEGPGDRSFRLEGLAHACTSQVLLSCSLGNDGPECCEEVLQKGLDLWSWENAGHSEHCLGFLSWLLFLVCAAFWTSSFSSAGSCFWLLLGMAESCFGKVKLLGSSSVNLATALTRSISAQTCLQLCGGCTGAVSAPHRGCSLSQAGAEVLCMLKALTWVAHQGRLLLACVRLQSPRGLCWRPTHWMRLWLAWGRSCWKAMLPFRGAWAGWRNELTGILQSPAKTCARCCQWGGIALHKMIG